MAITIEMNQKTQNLQIMDNIYIYIYIWGQVSQEVLLKLYELGLWPNPRTLTNPRMAK